jgi:DNA processing protein
VSVPESSFEQPMLPDDDACAAALASLGPSPGRLRRLLSGWSPRDAWEAVVAGEHPEDPDGRIHRLAKPEVPVELARSCSEGGVEVVVLGSARYPQRLAEDPQAPAVLFVKGDPTCAARRPAVAVVGTRSATEAGRDSAFEIGGTLAEAGVVVVSGLAPGIDLRALQGAASVDGVPAVAVLGAAHDGLVRPDQRRLAEALCANGAVFSELPPGTASARWRFAVRNRVLVALADLVVVVECHEQGGALHSVEYARRRAVPVAAVPGSIRSSASLGTNALLVAGALCVRHGADVIALLQQVSGWSGPSSGHHGTSHDTVAPVPMLDDASGRVLGALGAEPVTLDAVVLRSGQALATAALALEHLVDLGLARAEGGFWSRTSAPGRSSRRRPATS